LKWKFVVFEIKLERDETVHITTIKTNGTAILIFSSIWLKRIQIWK